MSENNWTFRAFQFALAFAIFSTANGLLGATGELLKGSSQAVPKTFFGMHAHRLEQPTPWPGKAVGSIRTWDAKVRWADLEAAPGVWDFSRLDRIVAGAQRRGIDVLIPFGMPPAWASSKPLEPSAYRPGEAALPKDIELWRRYIKKVATRYVGRVHNYEIWNEPNLPKFFSGSPEDAVPLTCAARDVLKEIDPTIRLVSPAPTGAYGVPWLKRFFAAGGGQCVDVVGFHFYNSHLDPESHLALNGKIRAAMAEANLTTKELWNTETGWLIASRNKSLDPVAVGFKAQDRVLTDDQSVSLIPRTLILHAAMGVSRFYWYALDNDMMGLWERDGAAKPAWRSYDETATLMRDHWVGPCRSEDTKSWSCDIADSSTVIAKVSWQVQQIEKSRKVFKGAIRYQILGRGDVSVSDAQKAYEDGYVVVEWLKK